MEDPQRSRTGRYQDVIHLLNQRYHEQWERAERLEQELAATRNRWFGPLVSWLRYFKRRFCPIRYKGRPGSRPGELRDAEVQRFVEPTGPITGRVSIIIPFKDQLDLLRGCLRSLKCSTYRDREVILVNNGSEQERTLRYLNRARERGRAVVDSPGPFNFSRLCNEGARRARGDFLVFLNNDTEVLSFDWLERMLRAAALPSVGVVGATLLYPDRTIQHAGLHPRADGHWIHAYRGLPADTPGDQGELKQLRTVPAVTGACLLLSRTLFETLGGFDELLPITYSDVDLCCRARQQGKWVVVTPHARLLHFEALSRGYADDRPGNDHLRALERFPNGKNTGV